MSLSKSALKRLYEEEMLSDAAIAARHGLTQMSVNRLRKRYGITTLTPADRSLRTLPGLTERQHQIVVGSLLGDGGVRATSEQSALFKESHSEQQREYLEWKVRELEPFSNKPFDTVKQDGDKTFVGVGFTTTSCPQFRRYYDLFYPNQVRKFPKTLPEEMTPLVFAVWFMDDGSSFNKRNARISFGLDSGSLKIALAAIRRLGLEPKVYGEKGNQTIAFMGQTKRFLEIVAPHVPPCMQYKLPVESPRQKVDRNAKQLTEGLAQSLSNGGLTDREIATMYKVGVSTVRRRLKDSPTRKPGPKNRLAMDVATDYLSSTDWSTLPLEEAVSEVVSVLRRAGFPYPSQVGEDVKDRHLKRLWDVGLDLTLVSSGLSSCAPFFPNRYHAKYQDRKSAFEAWHDDKLLSDAVRWQLKVGDPVVPSRVLKAICANARTPTIFRPGVASALYRRYAKPGDLVWDPCAGFGGRLLGAHVAGVRYIGTDVSPETVEGNNALSKWLGSDGRVVLHDAATFEPPSVQMVFTSPPYYRQERYEGGVQSWAQHGTYEEWLEGFLKPAIEVGAQALVEDGVWAMNIADVRDRKEEYPLVEDARRLFASSGLVEDGVLDMPIQRLHRAVGGEPVLVFRKFRV